MNLKKEERKATVSHQGTVRRHTATNELGTKRETKYASDSGFKMGTFMQKNAMATYNMEIVWPYSPYLLCTRPSVLSLELRKRRQDF